MQPQGQQPQEQQPQKHQPRGHEPSHPQGHDEQHQGHEGHDERHDFGLSYDLGELGRRGASRAVGAVVPGFAAIGARMDRRHLLKLAFMGGAAGIATLGFRRTAQAQSAAASCVVIPEETAGPYPGDGTNGPNVLTATGIVRSDITTSFAGLTGTAAGVPLSVTLTVLDAATCAPAKGYAVYLWHADQLGRYSLYSAGVTNQNYLRGVQETDAAGRVTFKTIFPGCYDGRWPHIHFEVYPSLSAAGDAAKRIATSQLAMPKAASEKVYSAPGYTASPANLANVSLATDGVFSDDGGVHELLTMTGSVANGFVGALSVTVSNTVKASGGGTGGPGGPGGVPGQQPPPGAGARGPGAPAGPSPTTIPTITVTTTTLKKAVPTTIKKSTKRTATTIKKKK
jgi:protocatechuate 3,4-dioxygenase beta subunit